MRKVLFTSSMAAITCQSPEFPKDYVFTEKDWSDEQFLRNEKLWYPLGKTLAEKTAQEVITEFNLSNDEHKVEFISILPPIVLGTMLQKKINTSSQSIRGIVVRLFIFIFLF